MTKNGIGIKMKKIKLKGEIVTDHHICECMCHNEGMEMLHCMPCCDLTYEKYIVDGKVDMVKWATAKQKLRQGK